VSVVTKIEEYRCAVALIEGRLHLCRLMADGTPRLMSGRPDWAPVEGPVGKDFLIAVNQALGTSFSEEDFRKDRSKTQPKRNRNLSAASL